MHAHEALIRRYFDACNAADYPDLTICFTPDAVHYFPPGLPDIPWRGADVIATKWIWCVENFGSQWTDIPMGELVEFDYKGRGYHLTPK